MYGTSLYERAGMSDQWGKNELGNKWSRKKMVICMEEAESRTPYHHI